MKRKYWGNDNEDSNSNDEKKDESRSISKVTDNELYFFSDINVETSCDLLKEIKEISSDIAYKVLSGRMDGIHLYINSGGGDLLSAFGLYDSIKSSKIPIFTYVQGYCASAATFLLLAGKKKYMSKNSYIMIHELSTLFIGKHSDLEVEFTNSYNLMKKIKQIYNEETKISPDIIEDILKKDLILDSEKCLEYGLIDEII